MHENQNIKLKITDLEQMSRISEEKNSKEDICKSY